MASLRTKLMVDRIALIVIVIIIAIIGIIGLNIIYRHLEQIHRLDIGQGQVEVESDRPSHDRMLFEMKSMKSMIMRMYRIGLFIVIVGGLLLLIGALMFNRHLKDLIVSPLLKLQEGIGQIEDGNLSYRIELDSSDEFEQLAISFNHMAGALQAEHLELISSYHQTLEMNKALEMEIEERERAEETIQHLAYHDIITNLPNRLLFSDRLTLAMANALRNKQMLAVMFLDLDRFKRINDTLGHEMGDQFLKIIAERLTKLLREGDTPARVGGDEFALILPQVNQVRDTVEIAQRIMKAVEQPWIFDDREFHITTSLGISIYPGDGENAEALLRNADIAMYRAKERGRNRYEFYNPTMSAKILERLELENSLRRAIECEEFVVYYQPRLDVNSGQVVAMEALIRWRHPDPRLGIVSPAEFIPLAEESGLIVPIGEWVLGAACAQNKAWQKAGFPAIRLAVNLSARQFQQKDLVETVSEVLDTTALDPHWLELEITEGVAMEDVDYTIAMLSDLREIGIHILIDDFGIGYSSLNYLKRLPINALKIDRSFVRDITTDPTDAAIVETIIALAKNLKLKAIAEGVETEEQLLFLKARGCYEVQGYLFSKPLPADEVEKMLFIPIPIPESRL